MTEAPLSTRPTDAFSDFHILPIYRCYVDGARHRLDRGMVADLVVPSPVQLASATDHPRDRRATAVWHNDRALGYLFREDNVLLGKFVRRGLPVAARLIGVQPDEAPDRWLSIEVGLLYPPSPVTDPQLQQAEDDRFDGLAIVAEKPRHRLRPSGDPLSLAHVYAGYYQEQDLSREECGWR